MNYDKMGTFLLVPSANKANNLSNELKITIYATWRQLETSTLT